MSNFTAQDFQIGDTVTWKRSKPNQVIDIVAPLAPGMSDALIVRKMRENGTVYGPKTRVGVDEITSRTR